MGGERVGPALPKDVDVDMVPKTVLIIDDSDELRSLLESILPFGGYRAIGTGTGGEGLCLAAEEKPDAILVDLELPDMNGLKVLESLAHQNPSIPTIMMTGYGSEGIAARALVLGASGYLIKPFTTEEVLSSVEKALSLGQLLSEKEQLAALVDSYRHHIKTLAAIAQTLASGGERDLCLRRIVEAGSFVTRADRCLLSLVEKNGHHFGIEAVRGRAADSGRLFLSGAADPRLVDVLEKGVSARLAAGPGTAITLHTGDSTQAVLQVPLKTPAGVVGFLSADRRKAGVPFGQHDEEMLSILADYAVLALKKEAETETVVPVPPSL
jgi:two-component system NtrC family sensor kinase